MYRNNCVLLLTFFLTNRVSTYRFLTFLKGALIRILLKVYIFNFKGAGRAKTSLRSLTRCRWNIRTRISSRSTSTSVRKRRSPTTFTPCRHSSSSETRSGLLIEKLFSFMVLSYSQFVYNLKVNSFYTFQMIKQDQC